MKRIEVPPAAPHQLTSVAWRRHRRALKGRRLSVQYRRQLGPGSRVLCRTLAFPRKEANDSRLHRSWVPDDSADEIETETEIEGISNYVAIPSDTIHTSVGRAPKGRCLNVQ